MVEGVVLAAGSSSRAGCFKMELPLGDKTLIERSLEGMYDVCTRIIVVGGYRIERVRELLSHYATVEVVENRSWQEGMFSSVKIGVQHVASERFFLLPADIPLVPASVFRSLLAERGEVIIPTYHGRRGHPVLLDPSITKEIRAEPDDSCLRDVLRRHKVTTLPVENEEILLDVDSLADYSTAMEIVNGKQSGGHHS